MVSVSLDRRVGRWDHEDVNCSVDHDDDLPSARELIETCLASGLGAGLLVWFGLFPLIGQSADLFPDEWVNGGGFGLSASAFGVAIVLSTMLVAVRWRFARIMRRPSMLARLAVALAASALVCTMLLTAFAAHVRYSTSSGAIAVEVLIAAAVLGFSIVVALRSMRRRTATV
jgi:hypothetical protein